MIELIAKITRKFHPRGTERFLRLFHDPNTVKGIETVVAYDGLKIHVNTSSFIEWQIFFKGSYEKDIADLIKRYCRVGGVFIDIGANVGVHTLTAARIAAKVIAFEPVPDTANRLRTNLDFNGFTNVEIRNEVVSDHPGKLILHVLQGANKTASVCDMAMSETTKEIECEAVTLDSALPDLRIDFIKVDTDGYDRNVLMGAKKIIEESRPVIIFEDSDATVSKFSRQDVDAMLERFGYSQMKINDLNTLCLPPGKRAFPLPERDN